MKFITVLIFLLTLNASADSMFDKRVRSGQLLYHLLVGQGLPEEAIKLLFKMYDYNVGRIPNTRYSVLVDYSLVSTTRRLYLIDFETGYIQRFYVSHGINSGILQTRKFANIYGSLKSALGFYYAEGTYKSSKNGISLFLEGIDRSNSNARKRFIVLHGADYANEDFIYENRRLGWSEGCFAVDSLVTPYLINVLKEGSIIFAYHRELLGFSLKYPDQQELSGREIVPPNVNPRRTPLEGRGDFPDENELSPISTPRLISPLDFYYRF